MFDTLTIYRNILTFKKKPLPDPKYKLNAAGIGRTWYQQFNILMPLCCVIMANFKILSLTLVAHVKHVVTTLEMTSIRPLVS